MDGENCPVKNAAKRRLKYGEEWAPGHLKAIRPITPSPQGVQTGDKGNGCAGT